MILWCKVLIEGYSCVSFKTDDLKILEVSCIWDIFALSKQASLSFNSSNSSLMAILFFECKRFKICIHF